MEHSVVATECALMARLRSQDSSAGCSPGLAWLSICTVARAYVRDLESSAPAIALAHRPTGRVAAWVRPCSCWPAVAVVAAGAVAAAPAMATTAPSMITNGNATNSAVRGPGHRLSFYWAANGV